MDPPTRVQTDLVIIGDGIVGLALAYLAGQNNINFVLLGKGLPGATRAATGFIAPRPDYLLQDRELVERTAYECNRWRQIFYPQILRPQKFLIPISPELPRSALEFEALLSYYDQKTRPRLYGLPSAYFKLSPEELAKAEPLLKKNYFQGAFGLWEWTVNPSLLLKKMHNEAIMYSPFAKRVTIKEISGFELRNRCIQEVSVKDCLDKEFRIFNDHKPLVVINATGPWISSFCRDLKIDLPIELKLGIQAQVLGQILNSGIITFGPDKKYVVCLPQENYIQIGPTNTIYQGNPDALSVSQKDIDYLDSSFKNILERPPYRDARFLKSGFRLKPFATDTNRPIIWHHAQQGIDNFYSLHPGKMALALLAGDELLLKLRNDGWLASLQIPSYQKPLTIDGNNLFTEVRLKWFKIRSLLSLGVYYLKFLVSKLIKRPLN